ncbi:MAG: hypothetical protein ACKO8C_05615, partial [Candidatus Nanopelagicaceae bacterium]
PAQLTGLDPKRTYEVSVQENLSAQDLIHRSYPGWWPTIQMRGDQLASIGLEMPGLRPEQGLIFYLKAL